MTTGCTHHHLLKAMLTVGVTFLFSYNMTLASNEGVDLFRQKRVLNAAQTFLEEGKRELARGGYVRSIRVLSQAINKGADPEAFKLRGRAYDSIGEDEKAVADFSSYIGGRGSDPEGYILRGDAHNAHHGHEKALADFTKPSNLILRPETHTWAAGSLTLASKNMSLLSRNFVWPYNMMPAISTR